MGHSGRLIVLACLPGRTQGVPFLFFLGILSGLGYGFDKLGSPHHSPFPPALAVNILGHVNIDVTQSVPDNLRPCAFARHMTGTRKLRKYPLSLGSIGSESLQKVVASIRVQIGMRVCTCEICHRGAYSFVCRG